MGYLVQTHFKNVFKDVRIKDLSYFEELSDVPMENGTGYEERFAFKTIASEQAAKELAADAEKLGLPTTCDKLTREKYLLNWDIYPEGYYLVEIYAVSIKAWKLTQAAPIAKGVTYFYFNGDWITKNELEQKINAIFSKY